MADTTPQMTGPQHYAEAKRLLSQAIEQHQEGSIEAAEWSRGLGLLHAQLATAAAAAETIKPSRAWTNWQNVLNPRYMPDARLP